MDLAAETLEMALKRLIEADAKAVGERSSDFRIQLRVRDHAATCPSPKLITAL